MQKLLTNNHRIRVINLQKHTRQVALASSETAKFMHYDNVALH